MAKPTKEASVSSSVAEGAELSDPLRWTARVAGARSGEVASVRFVIDGKTAHVEREAPYEFAGRGNLLLPGTVDPGTHTFAVDAELTDGSRLTAASTATVSNDAQGVPREVLGHWTRTVTAAEVRRTDDFRDPSYGEPLPVGTWTLEIGGDAVAGYVDPTPAHDLTVGQVRFQRGGGLVVGNEIPNFPRASEGGFCPDTVGTGEYRWSLEGDELVVRAVDDRECADRNSFWTGTFTR
ncbi:MAG: hypothetical protein ABW142_01295 [Thermoleophilaceae bacterium]